MAKQRRANGEGSFKKRKDGRVEYVVCVGVDLDGKTITKSFYGKNDTECRKKYKDWLKNGDKKKPIHKVKTVEEWATYWLEIYKKNKVAYGTYKNYKLYVEKHIVPELGKYRLTDVRLANIEAFFSKKSGFSRTAQLDMKTALNGRFSSAIDNGLCENNPTIKISIKAKKKKPT